MAWILILLVGVAVYAIAIYNGLQTTKTRIQASIQEIGNQLKRQANLIPNLSDSAKAYLKQEKEIFTMLTDARKAVESATAGDGKAVDAAVSKLNAVLPKLSVVVESNPELKSNEVISNLMNELRDTADKIMYARRSLIDLSQSFNQKLVTFPSNMIANAFGFTAEKGLEVATSGDHVRVSDAETKEVKVDL